MMQWWCYPHTSRLICDHATPVLSRMVARKAAANLVRLMSMLAADRLFVCIQSRQRYDERYVPELACIYHCEWPTPGHTVVGNLTGSTCEQSEWVGVH